MTQTPIRECEKCEGTGWTPSAKVTGGEMRFLRQQAGVSGSAVARAMGVTRAYVSALELGKALWTQALVQQYRAALDKAQQRGK